MARAAALGALLLALSSCRVPAVALPGLQRPTLPAPQVTVIRVADPTSVASQFLEAWKQTNYDSMYALLAKPSQAKMTAAEFRARYEQTGTAATLVGVDYEILASEVHSTSAVVHYHLTLHTALVGDLARDTAMTLEMQADAWRIDWADEMILPELKGGAKLAMDQEIPARGNIYDRNGAPLAYASETISLGVVPGEITDEKTLLFELSRLLMVNPDTLRAKYANALPDWYVPLGDVSREEARNRLPVLSGLAGLRMTTNEGRYYYGGGVGSHVVGYVAQVPKEKLAEYQAKGYLGDEYVGVLGLEQWGEPFLAGKHGGTLYVVSPDGRVLTTLAQSKAQPAYDIYTTLDRDLQAKVEHYGFGYLTGAAVVLRRDSGEVLAMVSSPRFDSNLFNLQNFNRQYMLPDLLADPRVPLLNRATQGQYPLGSVFKLVTIGGALQSGAYTPDSTYTCNGYFTELPGLTLTDWTVEKERRPHGKINLVQGLIQSCDPFFWHIGLDLFNRDPWIVPNMARGYGLGKATGIGVIEEASGFIPDPAWKHDQGGTWLAGDAVNMAIGQGVLQVTPLQVADFVAALGNGGTLYRPQLIQSIQHGNDPPVFTFSAEVRGKLPLSAENLQVIQEGMRGVVGDPRGTARYVFYGWEKGLAGKTGTAQDLPRDPHAWFVGYTYLARPDKPDIAAAVIAENAGEGSQIAAPILRRILEIYFYGSPQTRYPWEASIGGPTVTPTLSVTEAPATATPAP